MLIRTRLSLANCLPHLTHFKAVRTETNDTGVISIAKKCKDLLLLDISYCSGITDKSVKALSTNSKNLVHLGVNGVSKLSKDSLECLVKNCKHFRFLECQFCTFANDLDFQNITIRN